MLIVVSSSTLLSALIMNWKLLLIALTLIVGIAARPAEESLSETTTLKDQPETSTILIASTTETATKKVETTTSSATQSSSTVAPPASRYLISNMPTKPTNVRNKYANNYANLITKHTLSNSSNLSLNDSSLFVTFQAVVGETLLPLATTTSSHVDSTESNVDSTSTTLRSFPPTRTQKPWVNFKLEVPTVETQRPKKPVIHKIISKWSDNAQDVYNFNAQNPLLATQTVNHFDQLPAIYGQQLIHPHTTTHRPTTPPKVNVIVVSKKKRPTKNSTKIKDNCKKVRIKVGNKFLNKNTNSKENCDINIDINTKLHNVNSQTTTSDYNFPNNDKFEDNINDADYDSGEKTHQAEDDGVEVVTSLTQVSKPGADGSVKLGDTGDKNKKRKKKKHELGDDGSGIGSMVMTMMTMMAIFNPLNIGVWGVVFAPMAAMLFGGMCVAMYQFMHHPMTKQPQSWPASKPQEIVIRNKIKHSPIPIKVMHLHKHAASPPKMYVSEPMDAYGPPPMEIYGPPIDSYKPPPIITSYGPPSKPHSPPITSYRPPSKPLSPPITSYGAPPMSHAPISVKQPSKSYGEPPADSYFPVAPSGGPYKRKSNIKVKKPGLKPPTRLTKAKNSYKFKLL